MKFGGVSIQEHDGAVTLTVDGQLEGPADQEFFEQLLSKVTTHPAFVASAIVARYRAAEAELELDAITSADADAALRAYREGLATRRGLTEGTTEHVGEVSAELQTKTFGRVTITPKGATVLIRTSSGQVYAMPRELLTVVGTFLSATQL